MASESLDRELDLSEKLAWKLHNLVCHNCRRVAKQLAWLQQAASQVPEDLLVDSSHSTIELSTIRKEQIVAEMHCCNCD